MTQTMTATTTPCTIDNFSVATFMNPVYFNLKKSYHDEARGMYCFIMDKAKLGAMSEQQIKNSKSVLKYFIPYNFNIKTLDGLNTTLLFEMEDTEGFNPAKEINICIYDLDNDKILTHQMRWDKKRSFNAGTKKFPDEQWEGRKELYTEWERIGKTLQIKNSQNYIKIDKYAPIEIEPTLDALYAEIKDYDLYFFDFGERDKNHRTTFHASMVMTNVKRNGYKLLFTDDKCEFEILDSVCKIEKQLQDDSCGVENVSYSYKVYFTGSDVPLEFGVGNKIYVHPEGEI